MQINIVVKERVKSTVIERINELLAETTRWKLIGSF